MNAHSVATAIARKERDREMRRQDLLSAAESLFAERGFYHTSMEEIARHAGYGTGTVYLYFKSKEELYQALLHEKIQAFSDFLIGELDLHESAWDKLKAIIHNKFSFFRENQAFLRIYVTHFLTPDSSLSAGLSAETRQLHHLCHDLTRSVLEDGMRLGEFKPADPGLAKAAFTGLTDSVLLHCFQADDDLNVEETERFVTELFASGLRR